MTEHDWARRYGPWIGAFITIVGLMLFVSSISYTTYRNHQRTVENAKTAVRLKATQHALCDAAAGARDFWIGVRSTTRELLKDPTLSPIERESNLHYIARLDKVIEAANGVAHTCDGDQHP